MRNFIALLVAFVAVLNGCNKKQTVDLSSPKQAAKTLFQAMYDGDMSKAKACVLSGAGNDAAVDVGTKISTSMRKATDAIFKKFGDTIKNPNGQPINPNSIDPKD